MNPHLDFLLSPIYDRDALAPEHLADLRKSGLRDETIRAQRFRSVPPSMISQLLGFNPQQVRSAYLVPFPDPHNGGWLEHVRLKIFPAYQDRDGQTVKYLQPKRSGTRLFFPLATLGAALRGDAPLYVVEGEKKSLSVAQLGLPAVGFCGIENWHVGGSGELLADFAYINLSGRVVELVPDGDIRTNPNVERGALRFADALEARGARVRIVLLPVALRQDAAA